MPFVLSAGKKKTVLLEGLGCGGVAQSLCIKRHCLISL